MRLIVGLGNPGLKYERTRHNIGFEVIDRLAESWGISVNKEKWKAQVGEGHAGGEKVILMKPQTYMNLSGASVRPALDWLKGDREDLLVVYDDLDLPPGKIRLRLKGSAGGHRGVQSVIDHLGTREFKRIKIGIGRPSTPMPIPDFVLSRFQGAEEKAVAEAVTRSVRAVQEWIDHPFAEVMNRYNR
ncbi:peptidyl-tRNA hydrolase, PTH1 family [Melghirimyces thermohalophilus]|uniref:Peptidyl-tRNA hydrolase n=1 Tax=Melghirimyces thermohalophilus TaxID=1236220 RepID=A0A1G6Q391_9BACL|nr:aminoacyl-tRNA hydrolase [Melghirimyces thermohalophilus]SDC86105.1 peptidyl-tRNA hydrolase, PTH1 family [Melghirimyces thermohalophilus]